MPSTFGQMANSIIADASLQTYGMTAAMVMPWLVSAYEDLITCMPLGEATRQVELPTRLTAPYSEGTVGLVAGSDVITGTGTTFLPDHDNWFIRFKGINNNTWFRVNFVDATHLKANGFGIMSLSTLNGLDYVLVQRYGPEPTGVRWITHIALADSPSFQEVSQVKLDEMFPGRESDPALPLYWAKGQWTRVPQFRRYIEIYPPADRGYYVVVRGYHFIDEPTPQTYAYAGIPDQVILEGALAHAFDFIAGKLVEKGPEVVRSALDVAQRHRHVFEDFKLAASRRDNQDSKGPRLRMVIGSEGVTHPYVDPTSSAYWEVWRRNY